MWHIDEIIDSTCKQNKAKKKFKGHVEVSS